MLTDPNRLPDSWRRVLEPVAQSPTTHALEAYLDERTRAGANILAAEVDYFRSLEFTPRELVQVVILGQASQR